jgi:hypothetical protein
MPPAIQKPTNPNPPTSPPTITQPINQPINQPITPANPKPINQAGGAGNTAGETPQLKKNSRWSEDVKMESRNESVGDVVMRDTSNPTDSSTRRIDV